MIVHQSKQGPFRVVIEAYGGALNLFSPAHRSKVIKRAFREAGNVWLFKWMPKRFTNYAFMLGYRVSNKWKAIKIRYGGASIPFIGLTPSGGGRKDGPWWQRSGEKMATAARNGRVTASGSSGQEVLKILVPYGHPIQTEKAKVFRTVHQIELEDMAQVFARRLASEIEGARLVTRGNARVLLPKTNPRKTGGGPRRPVGVVRARRVA